MNLKPAHFIQCDRLFCPCNKETELSIDVIYQMRAALKQAAVELAMPSTDSKRVLAFVSSTISKFDSEYTK